MFIVIYLLNNQYSTLTRFLLSLFKTHLYIELLQKRFLKCKLKSLRTLQDYKFPQRFIYNLYIVITCDRKLSWD